jgi:Cdc6-like AAA superfamily ATPase
MKNIAELIDEYVKANTERKQLQKQADTLEEKEKDLLATIHAAMHKAKMSSSTSHGYEVVLTPVKKPVVNDWDSFRAYIRDTNNFGLLHARVTETAVKEIMESGRIVPGVELVELEVAKILKVK